MHILVGGSISPFGRSKRKEINVNTTWLPCKIAWWYVKSFLFFVLRFHEKWQHQNKNCVFLRIFQHHYTHWESVWCIQLLHLSRRMHTRNRERCLECRTSSAKPVCSLMRQLKLHFTRQNVQIPLANLHLYTGFVYIVPQLQGCKQTCARVRARSLIIAFAFILLFHPKCHKLAANSIFAVQSSWKNSSDSLIWYLIILLNENQYGFWIFAPHFNFSN